MKKKCYIYTRVSTAVQVDGYSLEAQREKVIRYAQFSDLEIAGEYSDEGKSGKSIEGRPQLCQMMHDIEKKKDNVSYVLVFKLSRFGRNAADVLSSLENMKAWGVNLICVEDGIDSSKDAGKLMISVLSAVAEIERENILVQTMAGREQKARDGKWNGGQAPYGYKIIDGVLEIAEDEVEVIRIIFDKYIHTTMGTIAIAEYLNNQGYKKKLRQNNSIDYFTQHFVMNVINNPVYYGKIAYGRRKNVKVEGTRDEYKIQKQDNYMLADGQHEGIVTEEEWMLAQKKRTETGGFQPKTHSLEHEHILSGILKCPVCGEPMYANVNRKKKKDGTFYKDYFFYCCKHRKHVNGERCNYHKQWSQEVINAAVEEVIYKLVQNPKFEAQIKKKIGSRIDTTELETEVTNLMKQLRQKENAKDRLANELDRLDQDDRMYERKYLDMQNRLYSFYDEIALLEDRIVEVNQRIDNISKQLQFTP